MPYYKECELACKGEHDEVIWLARFCHEMAGLMKSNPKKSTANAVLLFGNLAMPYLSGPSPVKYFRR